LVEVLYGDFMHLLHLKAAKVSVDMATFRVSRINADNFHKLLEFVKKLEGSPKVDGPDAKLSHMQLYALHREWLEAKSPGGLPLEDSQALAAQLAGNWVTFPQLLLAQESMYSWILQWKFFHGASLTAMRSRRSATTSRRRRLLPLLTPSSS
jgi:hypothetical protein